jgi:hypothetical protein
MCAYAGPVHWVDGEPDLAEYDIDNTTYASPRSKNACPLCGEPKLIGSKTCLLCYRLHKGSDPNWKGSAAWRRKNGIVIPNTTSTEETSPADLNLYLDPHITFYPTPLDPSLR